MIFLFASHRDYRLSSGEPGSVRSPGSGVQVADSPAGRPRRYRAELQGLRALAVALVVVYHVWLGRVSGGVDVFFLISGFLVTGQLFRAASRGGIEFRPMWGRMIKRLFPAALTVLVTIMAVSLVALPENRWFQTIKEVVAAALYLENWRLATDSADYFSQHNEASVVQHFWSLSIQGQFYVVWPLLVALVALVAYRTVRALRWTLVGCLLVVFTVSLAYSVALTAVNQPLAYFHSLTRVWEFALGGLLALCVDTVTMPRLLRIILGWLGVLGLVSCGLVLQVGSVFPGYVALWPTLCGMAVIAAGATGSRFGADRWLTVRPLEYVGNLSYALYLWHWPVLVFYLIVHDQAEVGLGDGVVIIGVSVLLSVLTYHLVEEPVRNSRIDVATRWGAYRFGVLTLAPVLVAAGLWQMMSTQKAASYAALVDDLDHPGALVRSPEFEYWGAEEAPHVPSMIALPDDFAAVVESRCVRSPRNKELEICSNPVVGPVAKRIVVVGDSHMQQYLAALEPIAQRRNWEITSILRGGCPFSTEPDARPGDQVCVQWNLDAAQEIIAMGPDIVFANGTRNVRVGLTEQTPPGFVEQWRTMERAGMPVLAVRDNPRYDFSPSVCANINGHDAPQCSIPRAELLAPDPPYSHIPDLPSNVAFLDLSDYFCTEDLCPPVIGNVRVYLDDNHVSATYMTTMSPIMEREIDARLGV